jgi:branched-chain amino acid transport system permease protein
MQLFLQLLVTGIEQGSIYALWALGYGLVFQILGLLNFAYGNVLMLSLYLVIGLVTLQHLSVWIAVVLAIGLAIVVSMLLERQVYARFVKRGQTEAGFVAALACAYILTNIATRAWGLEPKAFPSFFESRVFVVAGVSFTSDGLIVLGVALTVMAAFGIYLRVTKLGRAIVLAGQDPAAAAVVGIPVKRVVTMVYAASGLIGVIGALLFANLFHGIDSNLGIYITFQAFIAATVGGVGSLAGSLVGGLLLGVAESMLVGYGSASFATALAWVAMAAIAFARPRGLLGRQEVERV